MVCIWPAERFYLDSTTFNLKKKSIANISKYFVLISKSGFSLGAKKKKKGNTGAHFPIWQQLNAAFRRTCALELAIAPAAALSHPWLDLPRLRSVPNLVPIGLLVCNSCTLIILLPTVQEVW